MTKPIVRIAESGRVEMHLDGLNSDPIKRRLIEEGFNLEADLVVPHFLAHSCKSAKFSPRLVSRTSVNCLAGYCEGSRKYFNELSDVDLDLQKRVKSYVEGTCLPGMEPPYFAVTQKDRLAAVVSAFEGMNCDVVVLHKTEPVAVYLHSRRLFERWSFA